MSALAVTFQVDYAQPRAKVGRIAVVTRGRMSNDRGDFLQGWDPVYNSGVWQDPITGTLMLEPAPLNATWHTSNAGVYAKLAKADYTFTTAANYEDFELKSGAGYYIRGIGDTTANYAITSSVWGTNRGVFVSWFSYNVGNDDFEQLRFGFGTDTAHTNDQLWFKVWASGNIDVYWGTAKIGEGSLSGSAKEYEYDGGANSKSQRYIDLLVIPCRGREVLLYSPTEGGGFTVVIDSIDEGTASPQIIRSTDKLWWYCPNGQAQVQTAKMSFAASGYAISRNYKFLRTPTNPSAYESTIFQDTTDLAYSAGATLSLRNTDNSAVYSSGEDVRLKIALTSSSNKTPFIFGGMAEWATEIDYTDDSGVFTLDPYLTGATLSVPDSHENIEANFSLFDLAGAVDAGFNRPSNISDRPLRITDGNIVYAELITEPLEWSESANQDAITGTIRARSLWKLLEEYVFEAEMPLDGLSLEAAITKILTTCGIPSEYIQCSTSFYTISSVPATTEQANFTCEYHERGSDALNRLLESFAADWQVLEYPAVGHVMFYFISPDDYSFTPGLTLYRTTADAVAAGVAAADVWQVLIRDYQERSLNPEANEVTVVGFDLRKKKPIIAIDRDELAQDPTLAPEARPQNWAGFVRPYEFRHSMMTTIGDVGRARDILGPKLKPRRYMAQIGTELLLQTDDIPIWRGYALTLYGYGDVRIKSFQTSFVYEPTDRTFYWRPTTYVTEFLYDAWSERENIGTPTRTIGTTIAEIMDSFALRLAAKSFGSMRGWSKIINLAPSDFSGVP